MTALDTPRIFRAMKWHERAQAVATQKGVTHDDIAAALKQTRGSVSLYLRGDRDPGIERFVTIAKRLGVPASTLLGEEGDPSANIVREPAASYGATPEPVARLVSAAHAAWGYVPAEFFTFLAASLEALAKRAPPARS